MDRRAIKCMCSPMIKTKPEMIFTLLKKLVLCNPVLLAELTIKGDHR